MKSQSLKGAVAALALIGTAALATPGHAVTLTPAAKTAIAGVAAAPTADEKAVVALIEQVSPGATVALVNLIRTSPDTASLAANVEAFTALNPSLMAAFENAVAAFVADSRIAPAVASTGCAADTASIHSLVRIWCKLPALDAYPVVP